MVSQLWNASELIATLMLFDIGNFPADQPPVKYVWGLLAFTEWKSIPTSGFECCSFQSHKLSEEILSNFYIDPATEDY